MKFGSLGAITIAFVAIIQAEHIAAVPSAMSHEMSGTVQRTDSKTITILPDGSSKSVVFTWNSKETQFLRNGMPATVEALPIRAKVQIRCSHPIVGSPPLLYRVSWRTTAAGSKSKSH